MQWMQGRDSTFAYGHEHGYLVARGETEVRLTRFTIRKAESGLAAAVALEAARNVIVFPLGRGPGRPGGELELDALTEAAKSFAENYEAGADALGYPAWQHERLRVREGEKARFTGEPPYVHDYLHDPYAGHGPRRLVGIDEAGDLDGNAPESRYEAGAGIRPPRKSGKVRGVAREVVPGGGMELWHCDHDHAPGVHDMRQVTKVQRHAAARCATDWLAARIVSGSLRDLPIVQEMP